MFCVFLTHSISSNDLEESYTTTKLIFQMLMIQIHWQFMII